MAGPSVNLIFVLIFLFFYQNITIIYVNILIFIFNMLPIYPLDGGRILKYILCIFKGKKKSLSLTNMISNIMAILLSIGTLILSIKYKNIAYILGVIYIWIILIRENKIYKVKRNMYRILENNIAINKD